MHKVMVERKKTPAEPDPGRAVIYLNWLVVERTEKRGQEAL